MFIKKNEAIPIYLLTVSKRKYLKRVCLQFALEIYSPGKCFALRRPKCFFRGHVKGPIYIYFEYC